MFQLVIQTVATEQNFSVVNLESCTKWLLLFVSLTM